MHPMAAFFDDFPFGVREAGLTGSTSCSVTNASAPPRTTSTGPSNAL